MELTTHTKEHTQMLPKKITEKTTENTIARRLWPMRRKALFFVAGIVLFGLLAGCAKDNGTEDTTPGVFISATTPLAEANLNGSSITLTLTNATFMAMSVLNADQFTLITTPALAELSIASFTRDSNTAVTLTLAYDITVDFDVDSSLSVMVDAAAHDGDEDLTTTTVPITANADPMAVGTLSALVAVGGTVDVDVSGGFTDPGDTLTYAAMSSNVSIATVSSPGNPITITGMALGIVTITVTATDSQGQTATQTIAVTVGPNASLGDPAISIITEGGNDSGGMTANGSTTVTVDLNAPAPSSGLIVLVDITQMTPATTSDGVTYELDYGVTIADPQTDFSFDADNTSTLRTRRVEVPFASGEQSRELTITALEDVDGLSEVLSIALVDDSTISGYTVTTADTTTKSATRTLIMTDNEPVLVLMLQNLAGIMLSATSTIVEADVTPSVGLSDYTSPVPL